MGFARWSRELALDEVAGSPFKLAALDVDAEGRLVAGGTLRVSPQSNPAAVLRFLANGAPDPSFGVGGAVVEDFGIFPPTSAVVSVASIDIDDPGRILVAGQAAQREGCSYCDYSRGFVARFTEAGAPDPTFGVGGSVAFEEDFIETVGPIRVAPGNGLWLSGHRSERGGPLVSRLLKLGDAGLPATGWGAEGAVRLQRLPFDIEADRKGRIVIGLRATNGSPFALRRLLPSGAPDRSFGADGTAAVHPRESRYRLTDLVLTEGGGAVVVGTIVGRSPGRATPRRRLAVGRLGPGGRIDKRFGNQGLAIRALGKPSNSIGRAIFPRGKGAVVAIGLVTSPKLRTGVGIALYGIALRR